MDRNHQRERGDGGKETTVLKTVICFVLNCTNFVAQKGRFHHFMRAALHQSNIITRRELLALLGFISVQPVTFIYKIITRRSMFRPLPPFLSLGIARSPHSSRGLDKRMSREETSSITHLSTAEVIFHAFKIVITGCEHLSPIFHSTKAPHIRLSFMFPLYLLIVFD